MVFSTFWNPSRSKGSFGAFFFESSLNVTFFHLLSSIYDLFSKAIILLSTDNASFMFSTRVSLLALSTKNVILEGREDMYHSNCTYIVGLEEDGILFNNLLNMELNSLILSFKLAFMLETSLIKDVMVLSSPNFTRNISSKAPQVLIKPVGREKYQDPTNPWKV